MRGKGAEYTGSEVRGRIHRQRGEEGRIHRQGGKGVNYTGREVRKVELYRLRGRITQFNNF